ncbi:hypothetical protein WMY93_031426 [Mugilogobius chulae]|uniref:Uncharacterized protein n=1 Tax=Mugilogobius chulae TaxID=88201 RepID=A0AAW0MDE3_9GOBI
MMPVETLPQQVRRPLRTPPTSTPPRLRPKAPVAPDLYRQCQAATGRPKQSAVERLEADKAKYVKSQVALSKQQPVRPAVVTKPPQSPHPALQPTRKTPVPAKTKDSIQLDLEHLSNLISDVNDPHSTADDAKAPETVPPQKKERPRPPPRPDWSSPAKVRLKSPAPTKEESPSSPTAAGTVRRVDVLPQTGSARPPVRPFVRQPLQPILVHSQLLGTRLFHPRTPSAPSPLKPVVATPPKPENAPLTPPLKSPLLTTADDAVAPPETVLMPPPSPAFTRLSSSSGRKRPSLTRSKSDLSDRFSRAGTELERFFNLCGVDPSDLRELNASSSDIVSLARFRSVSAPGSECGASGQEEENEEEEESAGNDKTRVPYGVSVIERNARVIKWLYGLRQAKDNANKSTNFDFVWRCKERVFKQIPKSFCRGNQNQRSRGISLRKKLCYAAGGVPYQLTTVAISVSLQIFLLDVVQMEAFHVSLILFVSRAWDAVTDPLIGYLVSRSSWTPIGKMSPWLVLSCPFAILSYVLLWFVPRVSMSPAQTLMWFLAVTCLFETLMSCFNVPYLSLNMFLGGTKRERDSATAYRMSVEMVAMLVASIIQGQVVAVYNKEKQKNCEDLEQTLSTSSPASLQDTRRAFLTSALVIGAMFFLCSLVIFLGVKEQRSASESSDVKTRLPFFTSFKLLLRFAPYHRLVLAFTVCTLAYQGSATVAVPIWQAVLLKIGKKPTIFIGLTLFIPAVIVVACFRGNLTVFIMMCAVMGVSVATVFLLPWSMLPDVVDEFTIRNPDCTDLEPLFFSCYAFCNKLAGGLAAGVSTVTLQFVGYKPGACYHSDEVVTALLVLFSPVPIALLLLGMLAFLFYPINERLSSHPQEQISTVDSKVLSSSSDQEKHRVLHP